MNELDILAFGAHPDDVEISAGGTLVSSVEKGYKVGIVDLTMGELGSRGSGELRLEEARLSSKLIGLTIRENLRMRDGFFTQDEESLLAIIRKIRKYKPKIILCNSPSDRHPDHGRGGELTARACFLSGLRRIETEENGRPQEHWRPKMVYHYIQDYYLKPDFVMDISNVWDKKVAALQCFSSQFWQPDSKEPSTPISGPEFFEFLKGRAIEMGRPAGFLYAEGFIATRTPAVDDLMKLI